MEKLTKEAYSTCEQMTLWDSPNAISSPESEDGHTRSDSPDGRMKNLFGPAPVHAHPSHQPGKRNSARSAKESQSRIRERLESLLAWNAETNGIRMDATSGPSSPVSYATESLQKSLENRLRERMGLFGSPEYALTWKHWDTPLGPPICALRASGHRTSGKDCTGWATPTAVDHRRGDKPPRPTDTGVPLSQMAALAGWVSPQKGDADRGGQAKRYLDKSHAVRLNDQVLLSGWNTPRATDGSNGGPNQTGGSLPADAANVTGWVTPTTRDWKDGGEYEERPNKQPFRTPGDLGFWSEYELIQCGDGKARRIEPGTFPLAHGVPARVGRLRGYGNAINPILAKEFILASEEAVE